MAFSQGRDKRKLSGGRKRSLRTKRRSELGNQPTNTIIAKQEKEMKKTKKKGGRVKTRLTYALEANVLDTKTKKYTKAKILTEKENAANRNFPRRNIITKGAIIELEGGSYAKITSRPSQDGVVNAVKVDYVDTKKK